MKNIVIFMPAYQAENTVLALYQKIPKQYQSHTFLVDDHSTDRTFLLAKHYGIESYRNQTNLGYGGNLKVCIQKALAKGGDIIIEMHPDGEYDPSAIEEAIDKVSAKTGLVLGNRIDALISGMYWWKYFPSKILTQIDNAVLHTTLSDLHQGFRVYTKELLLTAPYLNNSNSYLFSFQIIAQSIYYGFGIEEIPVKTKYTGTKRGASLKNSLIYTLSTFQVLCLYLSAKAGFPNHIFTHLYRNHTR